MTSLHLQGNSLWFAGASRQLTDVDRAQLEDLCRRAAAWNRGRGDAWLAELGRELYRWLDPWGAQLRDNVALDVIADAVTVRDAPWELLHDGKSFLVDRGVEVVRRLEPESTLSRPAPEHGLTLVFLAASPRPDGFVEQRLRYEEEEAAILQAVGDKKLCLSVEETGTARGLGLRLDDLAPEAPAPVVHITCHGAASPAAVLMLENEQGGVALTSPAELVSPEGAGYRLGDASLVVVSACETAAPDVAGFAVELVRRGIRAALGWSASVSDAQATVFAAEFYEKLHRGWKIDRALNAARRHLRKQPAGQNTDWHLARLVAGPHAGGPVVRPGGRLPRLGPGSGAFLGGNRKVPIATRLQFVGRRRHLQDALRVLADSTRAGVVLTGLGHQGKSSLAGRLADRHHGPVAVCWGAEELTAPWILQRVQQALGTATTTQAEADRADVARDAGALQDKLSRILGGADRPVLLILDDIEQVLELDASPVSVRENFRRTLLGVLEAFRLLAGEGRRHRLVLTSRVCFRLPGVGGDDVVAATLGEIHLPGLPPVERALLPTARDGSELPAKERALCLDASAGNPGLVATLFALARDLARTGELARLPDLLARKPGAGWGQDALDAWMVEVVGVLVDRLTGTQKALLEASWVLPGPVPRSVVLAALGPRIGATEQDAARLEALGLWECHIDEETGMPAVCPAPLALRRLASLSRELVREFSGAVWTPLRTMWATPRTLGSMSILVRLALAAEKGEGLAGPAEMVLAAHLAAHEVVAARTLGRAVVARLVADGLVVPDGIRWRVADAVETESPDEALSLLKGVEDAEITLLRRGRLHHRRGELDLAEECFRGFSVVREEDPRNHALAQGHLADILEARGQFDEALRIRREELLPAFERLGDVRSRAVTMGQVADILQARGQLDEVLRIRREEELPVYERLGDVRSRAVTMGRVVDILQMRGLLDEALRILREELLPVFEHLGDVHARAVTMGKVADILQMRGQLDEALRILREELLPIFERLGDVRARAVTMGKVADILQAQGQLDEALRIRREEELPVYERLGDVHARAVTMGRVADILQAQGQLDEALRILREELLPVFERLGDVRLRAVTMGKVADILQAQEQLDEALRILHEELLPVFERLGDVRERAVTMGQVADILQARGQLNEALRILREEQLPVYERLDDVRERAVTMGKVADILQAQGQLDEALRILREEQLPVYERLGDVRSLLVARANLAIALLQRGRTEDEPEALEYLQFALQAARAHDYSREVEQLESLFRQLSQHRPT